MACSLASRSQCSQPTLSRLCPPPRSSFFLYLRVQVQIGKPSYAQICEVDAVLVNGVDCTSLAVFEPARELGSFADPEGLRKVSVSCGVRCRPALLAVDIFGANANNL